MIECQGSVATPRAPELLPRLCRHFAKKASATWDEVRGEVEFPWGHCAMQASATALDLRCSAADEAALAQVRNVLDLHIGMFSRRDPLQVDWR